MFPGLERKQCAAHIHIQRKKCQPHLCIYAIHLQEELSLGRTQCHEFHTRGPFLSSLSQFLTACTEKMPGLSTESFWCLNKELFQWVPTYSYLQKEAA